MARRSKRKSMQTLSALLFLAVIGLLIKAVSEIGHHDFLSGVKLIGWMFISLFVLLGFTWRTSCKVKTSRSKPCRNEAYGFLFGCNKAADHFLGKFLVRLGLKTDAVKEMKRRRTENIAVMYQAAPQERPIRLTVENDGLGVCGFWVGVVSAVAGIIQVITVFTVH